MCGYGAFFSPTAFPPMALLSIGGLLSLAVLGSILWLAAHWRNQGQFFPFSLGGFFSRETAWKYAQGSHGSEPKQEYEQPRELPPQELPS